MRAGGFTVWLALGLSRLTCRMRAGHPALLQGTRPAWLKARGIVRTDRELHKLFTTLALRYKDRRGACTRLVRAGWRERDAAPVAFVE